MIDILSDVAISLLWLWAQKIVSVLEVLRYYRK